jgi:hypothetical protein
MTVYIVLYWDGEGRDINAVFSSYELADNYVNSAVNTMVSQSADKYVNSILSNDKKMFMDNFSIDEYVIDQPY